MTPPNLSTQFDGALSRLDLGARRAIAVAAHLEVRNILCNDDDLLAHGLKDVLIGSYARRTAIWPGKDVDVFGKLTREAITSIEPQAAFDLFWNPLLAAFPGRVTPQARSIKVAYRPSAGPAQRFVVAAAEELGTPVPDASSEFEFSVDVVPAVQWGQAWGIPNRERHRWTASAADDRWTRTNPERLTALTRALNKTITIDDRGAYVPTVKAIRQIRRHHLRDARPGGLYLELLVCEAFSLGRVAGDTWAEIITSTLRYVAHRLATVGADPLCDPALDTPYAPAPDSTAVTLAAEVFSRLAAQAESALVEDLCPAATSWRAVFGDNTKPKGVSTPILELPTGCRADGSMAPVYAAPRHALSGSDEAHGFGQH